jgi:acyl carrier protein
VEQQRNNGPAGGDGDDWEPFVVHLADVAGVAADAIVRETRLVEDLNLDSLGLTEAVVILLADLDLEELPDSLAAADWSALTVGDVYDACRGTPRGRRVLFERE